MRVELSSYFLVSPSFCVGCLKHGIAHITDQKNSAEGGVVLLSVEFLTAILLSPYEMLLASHLKASDIDVGLMKIKGVLPCDS